MRIGWLDTKEVDEFADSVVAELLERFPPAGVDLSTRKAVDRAMRNVDKLMLRATDFASRRRLSLYQKARFGNRVKWALKEARYPPQFVEVMTEGLVTQVALASRKARAS